MSIQPQVNELNGIKAELKTLNARAKKLRARKKHLEAEIAAYIKSKDLPGVKHRGAEIRVEEKTKRAGKSNQQRDKDAMDVLAQYGIRHPDRVLQELMEARKGEEIPIDKLKMKLPKKKRR
jgi:hypothetical protein